MSQNEAALPQWVKNSIAFIYQKQFGFILFGTKDKVKLTDGEQDENNLIDANKQANSPENIMWRNECSLIDKVTILLVLIAYVIMCFTLIPVQYARSYNQIQEAS